jgi:hypothetical protein
MTKTKPLSTQQHSSQAPTKGVAFGTSLPYPTPQGVEKFRQLYLTKFGVELEPKKALELAIQTLQFVYLATTKCPDNTNAQHPNNTPEPTRTSPERTNNKP